MALVKPRSYGRNGSRPHEACCEVRRRMQAAYEGEVENTADGDQHDKNGTVFEESFLTHLADP